MCAEVKLPCFLEIQVPVRKPCPECKGCGGIHHPTEGFLRCRVCEGKGYLQEWVSLVGLLEEYLDVRI